MKCNKCGTEYLEESVFCNKCGAKLSKNNIKSNKINNKLRFINNKRNIVIVLIASVILIIFICIICYVNDPVYKFINAIKDNNQIEATSLYSNKIKGDSEKENEVSLFLKDQVSDIEQNFIDEKIDFDKAKEELEAIKKIELLESEVNSTLSKIINLNNSRIAFSKAEAFIEENDYMNAIKEFKQVIADDKNYEKAKGEISNNESKYKEQVLKEAEESAKINDYNKAVSILNDATAIIGNDSDISVKLAIYSGKLTEIKEEENKQKIEKAKTDQLLVVDSAKIVVQSDKYKALYPDQINVMVTNKSDKAVKNMDIGFLAYDKNGYPLKIKMQFDFTGSNYESIGNADNVNILPGASFGEKNGWSLDETHGISTVIACVKNVEFYDGTKWTNSYYSYWISEYKEKQLK